MDIKKIRMANSRAGMESGRANFVIARAVHVTIVTCIEGMAEIPLPAPKLRLA
jgi:hypothetical protein